MGAFFLSGALTKGDRRAATGADLTQFNFDTTYGRSALRNMYQSITLVCWKDCCKQIDPFSCCVDCCSLVWFIPL